MKKVCSISTLLLLAVLPTSVAFAGLVSGLNPNLTGGNRWDAAARTTSDGERSLSGGLTYSMQGGSYENFRNLITWSGTAPTANQFQGAVERAFSVWTQVDPVSGFGTQLSFNANFGTAVVGQAGGGVNTAGAEIDILASNDGAFWNPGNVGTQGETFFGASGNSVTLTSGTSNYTASAIDGADIRFNSNGVYTLDIFQVVLMHEVGHAIGLLDVERGTTGLFIDDDYDGTTSASALATLNNSWAAAVNALDPSSSALNTFFVANGTPGIDTPGVDILMESNIPLSFLPNMNIPILSNDDFGTRQFLYPEITAVPEPGSFVVLGVLGVGFVLIQRRRRRPVATCKERV